MENAVVKSSNRIHPLVATAAGAVIIASAVGVAAMTGLLPKAHGNDAPAAQSLAQAASTPAVVAQAAPAPTVAQQAPVAAMPPRTHHYVAPRPARAEPAYDQPRQVAYDRTAGTVESITPVTQQAQSTGLGAVGGAVAGGLLGNQFGRGNGRTVATVVGALGGGLAGNVAEQRLRSTTDYEVRVRMSDGSVRTINYQHQPDVAVGQRVHVEGNEISGAA